MQARLPPILHRLLQLGADPADSLEVRLRKTLLVGGSCVVIPATAVWGGLYIRYGEPRAAAISLSYALITLISLLWFRKTRRYLFLRFSQLALGLILPFLLMLVLGGFTSSSAVILWSFIAPMGALLLYETRPAALWWFAFVLIVALGGLLDPFVRAANDLPAALVTLFFVLNILGVSGIAILFLFYFIDQKDRTLRLLRIEEQKSESLLLNILPREIAPILKNEHRTIAEQFDQASILFADLVGFTPLTAELPPDEMVSVLNEIFSNFDALVEQYDLEKIRTIGDNYMVASGAPRRRPDHAQALARLALDLCAYLESRAAVNGRRIQFRIGINSGPVIGGVIGQRKFVYDLWGDPVNIASRMESQGVPGKIQITTATRDLIQDQFEVEPRGTIEIKGRGQIETWFLVGERKSIHREQADHQGA